MKRFFTAFILTFGMFFVALQPADAATSTASKLSGRILLQVQDKGQAWYVNPANNQAYYMGRPADALELMKRLGVGITDYDLRKIAVAPMNYWGNPDMDHDGLSDAFEYVYGTDSNNPDTDYDGYSDTAELINGYNPFGQGKQYNDTAFAKAHKGKIFLQVQRGGAAWYINPVDLKAYYLGKPQDAFNVMRSLGLGVTNETLYQIPGTRSAYTIPAKDTYSLRMFNVDNVGTAVVNGKQTYTASYGADRVEDITGVMTTAENKIQLKMYNDTGSYTWGFEIKKNGRVIFSESAGSVGKTGANNNDGSKTNQIVYDKTVTIGRDGAVTVAGYQASTPAASTSAPASRWYIRTYNGDDTQVMVVNDKYSYVTTSFGQDSGYIDITHLMTSGTNTIDFATWNDMGGYTWGFQLKKDNTIVFDDKAGTAGTIGAYNNDYSRQNRYVYYKTLTINESGAVSVTNNLNF